MADEAARRYAEIMRDVEVMIDDHISVQNDILLTADTQQHLAPPPSKLKLLVPSVGPFFTRLPLEAAFKFQDRKRYISSRRFVSPSFNDVRLILNSSQIMAVTTYSSLQLATFDGDVTLYDDGQSLEPSSPIVPRLLDLLKKNVKIGIVTAAGYTTADRYYARLHGLLDALASSTDLSPAQKANLLVMGGEANYLFAFDAAAGPHWLRAVPRNEWLTPEMMAWGEADIAALLDDAEAALRECVKSMNLPATLMRKDRAVGIIPEPDTVRIPRESLEETVLVVQRLLENSLAGRTKRVPFCALSVPFLFFLFFSSFVPSSNLCLPLSYTFDTSLPLYLSSHSSLLVPLPPPPRTHPHPFLLTYYITYYMASPSSLTCFAATVGATSL